MKKSLIALGVLGIFVIGGGLTVSATENTAKPTKVQALMNEGKSFEEAKNEMLNFKYQKIDSAVAAGNISEEEALALKEKIAENVANCTEPGSNSNSGLCTGLNKDSNGVCIGKGKGQGQGQGQGQKNCNRNGQGKGNKLGNCSNLSN